jgi:hypothetical protein
LEKAETAAEALEQMTVLAMLIYVVMADLLAVLHFVPSAKLVSTTLEVL